VELTSALAWENYRARFDHALKIDAEGFSEGAFCPLPIVKVCKEEFEYAEGQRDHYRWHN